MGVVGSSCPALPWDRVDRSLSMVVVRVVPAAEALSPFAQVTRGYTRCDSNTD